MWGRGEGRERELSEGMNEGGALGALYIGVRGGEGATKGSGRPLLAIDSALGLGLGCVGLSRPAPSLSLLWPGWLRIGLPNGGPIKVLLFFVYI
jgi:hypothetical protein